MAETKYGNKWSEDETILAFYYYCQMPFGKIHKANPDIINIASLLGRTPSAVALKMGNLGHFDPELQKRNVSGLRNASKIDAMVVARFFGNWEELTHKAKIIETQLLHNNDSELVIPVGNEKVISTKTRINQQFFRNAVLTSYSQQCCITGMNIPELLVASHIKPWSVSDPKTERTNPSNGLCLNALHDKAFDLGLITVRPDYTICVSSKLQKSESEISNRWLIEYDKQQIIMPSRFLPNKEYLEYHNDVIFVP